MLFRGALGVAWLALTIGIIFQGAMLFTMRNSPTTGQLSVELDGPEGKSYVPRQSMISHQGSLSPEATTNRAAMFPEAFIAQAVFTALKQPKPSIRLSEDSESDDDIHTYQKQRNKQAELLRKPDEAEELESFNVKAESKFTTDKRLQHAFDTLDLDCRHPDARFVGQVAAPLMMLSIVAFWLLWHKFGRIQTGHGAALGYQHAQMVGPSCKEDLVWVTRLAYVAAAWTGMVGAIEAWNVDPFFPTGLTTYTRLAGVELARGKGVTAFMNLYYPLNFVAGSIVAGILTRGEDHSRTKLETGCLCVFVSGIIILCVAIFNVRVYGAADVEFSCKLESRFAACFAMGVQGGGLKATTGFLDVTGVSGGLTDVGLIVGRAISLENRTKQAAWKAFTVLGICFNLTLGFFLGGLILVALGTKETSLFLPGFGMILTSFFGLHKSHTIANDEAKKQKTEDACNAFNATPTPTEDASQLVAKHDDKKSPPEEDASQSGAKPNDKKSTPDAKENEGDGSRDEGVSCCSWVCNGDRQTVLLMYFFAATTFVGWTNYNVVNQVAGWMKVSHLTGAALSVGIGAAELITKTTQPTGCEVRSYAPVVFVCFILLLSWFAGTCVSGVVTRTQESKSLGTLAHIFLVVGALIFASGFIRLKMNAFGYCHEKGAGANCLNESDLTMDGKRWEPMLLCCFAFGLLNGVMNAVTGFARTGHMTGNWMNVGLLTGQMFNPRKRTPEIFWKLKATAMSIVCHAIGAGLANRCDKLFPTYPLWIDLSFSSILFALLGFAKPLHSLISDFLAYRKYARETPSDLRLSYASWKKGRIQEQDERNAKVLADLTRLGQAGGYTDGVDAFPSIHHSFKDVARDVLSAIQHEHVLDQNEKVDESAVVNAVFQSVRERRTARGLQQNVDAAGIGRREQRAEIS